MIPINKKTLEVIYLLNKAINEMTDGSFHFVPTPRKKSSSITLKKLPHGKLSETADGAIQLTLKIYKTETGNLYKKLLDEAKEALK